MGYLVGSINIQGSYVIKSLAEVDNMFVLEEYRKYRIGTKLIVEFKENWKRIVLWIVLAVIGVIMLLFAQN